MNLNSESLSWPVARLNRTLKNLLFWLEVPDAATTSRDEWLETMTEAMNNDFGSLVVASDQDQRAYLRRMNVDANHFANLLHSNPGISIANWTKDFPDCLGKLRAFVRELEQIEAGGSGTQPSTVPEDSLRTMAGDIVLRNELTEEDRPTSEWAKICGFCDDTFRNRMSLKAKGATWRIVESGSQRYRIHLEDLPKSLRGSKNQRDEHLKKPKD